MWARISIDDSRHYLRNSFTRLTKRTAIRMVAATRHPPPAVRIAESILHSMTLTDAQVNAVWAYLAREAPRLSVVLAVVDLRLTSARCAARVGLPNSAELERELRRLGLPRFALIRDWYFVYVAHAGATSAGSMSRYASGRGVSASVFSRFVDRVTRTKWRDVQRSGEQSLRRRCALAWVVDSPTLLLLAERGELDSSDSCRSAAPAPRL